MTHYHIRWVSFGTKLDWEAFRTREEAHSRADQLVQSNETFTIEQFDGNCPRCNPTAPAPGAGAESSDSATKRPGAVSSGAS